MALYDVDKTNLDRSSPMPNTHGRLPNGTHPATNVLSTAYTSDVSSPGTRIVFKNNLILYYDDQNRIIRVDGFIPSLAAYPVTIIAQYGYDVYTDILGLSRPGPY